MRTTRHDVLICPECGEKLDASTNRTDDAAPQPGDVAICLECVAVLTYGDGLILSRVTDPDTLALPDVVRVRSAVEAVVAQRRGPR